MANRKLYPSVETEDWLKFTFKHNNQQFVIRFAGKPLYMLERLYEIAGWTNFMDNYNKAKAWEKLEGDEYKYMSWAVAMCELILNLMWEMETPLVVYIKDIE